MKHKLMSILLSLTLSATLLTGCVKNNESTGKPSTPEKQTAEPAAGTPSDSDDGTSELVLDAVDISEFNSSTVVTDFVPANANTRGTKEDGTPWKIGWSSLNNSTLSLAYMTTKMEELSEEYGFELVTYDAQGDPQKQTSDINNAVTQKCDALIVTPIDATSQLGALKAAKDAGLVVVNIQNPVSDAECYDLFVGPNDVTAAQQAASILINQMPEGGKIVMVNGNPGETCQIDRSRGFKAVLSQYPEFEILEEQGCLSWSTAEAMSVMESYLSKYPDIDGVFCQWDIGTATCIQAAETAGRAEDIVFVSVDGVQAALDAIAAGGPFKGTSMQDFETNTVIQTLATLAYLNGDSDKLDKNMATPNICITQENADNFKSAIP
ncbi:sugar ABC transporter substrate-binding protein [Lawsonibacter sp. OA9]|uniref:sugar ABC transporter substrate-binding protein n=1 Tax=Oscillospiraceae TaxID=216572 RepID=UPI001F0672C9|nr:MULTISPECIES: sugar ABC transporter substrate-binding protein [Oscillospiraceae]MCH1978289.1 sugar ABC transporter substrate-binding protein [Lawsonibacter sp. OA9]MCH1981445.1 sugar ABC transporter substrate-binding protein [Ruminococcus sp. OA3]